MKTQLKIQLLGSSFSIQSEEDREHVEDVIEFYQRRLADVLERNTGTEPVKIALLTGLNLADELLRLRKNIAAGAAGEGASPEEVDSIARHLIEKIDAALDDEK